MSKKEFLDEKIIEMMNEVEQPAAPVEKGEGDSNEIKPEDRTIYTGIKIKTRWVYFEPRLLFDDKLSMMIPTEFIDMPLEQAKTKYPSEQRPEIILMDDTTSINFMFTHMEEEMRNEDSEMIRDQVIGMMQRLNPGIKPLESGVEIVSEKNVAYVEFSNPVMDGKLYNLMYFLEFEGRTLMICFNCRTNEMKYWKKPAFEVLQSIKFREDEDNESNTQ